MMNIQKKMFRALFAMLIFLPLAFSSSALQAQTASAPRINGFDVEQVRQLVAGNELVFTLYGSPGGTARVRIDGVDRRLRLEEVETGVYEGAYTIKVGDRIAGNAVVTANLRVGNQIASAVLDESLVGLPGGRYAARSGGDSANSGTIPRIDRFNVQPASQLVAGDDLLFTLNGSPGGVASIRIEGVRGKILLDEVRQGVYEGNYAIKNRDRIAPNAAVTANLRVGDRDVNAILRQSLLASASTPDTRRAPPRSCPTCGVVESINVVQVKGDGSYIGMIAGGLAGVLLGSQVGQGRGTTAAEIAGAAGGAYAGNEIEKRVKTSNHYEVIARLEDGGTQTVSYAAQPSFKVGDRVRVENGTLVLNQ